MVNYAKKIMKICADKTNCSNCKLNELDLVFCDRENYQLPMFWEENTIRIVNEKINGLMEVLIND